MPLPPVAVLMSIDPVPPIALAKVAALSDATVTDPPALKVPNELIAPP